MRDPGRPHRAIEGPDGRWLAVEAWRGEGGHGLCHLFRLRDGETVEDDREDRRAALEPGERLEELEPERAAELVAAATPLTETERRFRDADGRAWLAQNSGPVWAGPGVAAGLTGIVFTALEGGGRRVEAPGGHVADLSPADLARRLRGAPEGRPSAGAAAGAERPADAEALSGARERAEEGG